MRSIFKNIRYGWPAIIMAGIIAVGTVGSLAGKEKMSPRQVEQQREKARHFYLSGARFEAEEKPDMAAEMYRRAYETDPDYPEAALQHGIRSILLVGDTLPESKKAAVEMAQKFADAYPADIFSNLMFGKIMERVGDNAVYVRLLEKVSENNPGNTDLLRMLASAYANSHDYEKALKNLEQYAQAEGEDVELTVEIASVLLETGDTVRALDRIGNLERNHPNDPSYPALKAQMMMYLGMQDSAIMNAKRAEKMIPAGEYGHIQAQLAELYQQVGDSLNYDARTYDALLSEDLDLDTKNALLAYYLQKLISDQGDRARGDRLFDGLIALYPHEASVRELSSRYNASKQDFAKAEEDINYALDLDHTNEGYWELAMMYAISLDKPGKIKDVYTRASKNLEPLPLPFQILSGNAFVLDKKPEESIKIYERVLADYFPGQDLRQPLNMDSLRQYLNRNNIMGLIDTYRQAGDAFYEMNERDNAFINFENALTLDSDNPLLLNNYAYFLIKDPTYITPDVLEKADKMSERAVGLEPGNPIYTDTRAWVLFMEEDYEGAKEIMETLFEEAGEDDKEVAEAEYYFHYGDILYMTGDKDGAHKTWTTALELAEKDKSPDAEQIKELKNRLKAGVPESALYKLKDHEKITQEHKE